MNFLRKISNWKTLSMLFVIYVAFAAFVMPGMMEGGDVKITPLDLLFSYSPERAYALLSSYGDLREHYAFMSLTADTAYPIIYTALFMVSDYGAGKVSVARPPKQAPPGFDPVCLLSCLI